MYIHKTYEDDKRLGDDPSDRRSIQRRHLIYYLRVWDTKSGNLLGHLVDITTEGLMLISEQKIPKDTEYLLEIHWHDAEQGEQRIGFSAKSMWSSNDVNPMFHDTGFKFLDNSKEMLAPIQALIEQYGFRD